MALKEVSAEQKFRQNPAGIFLLMSVRRPERSESPQGVAKLQSNFEFRIRWWWDAAIF